MEDPERTSDWLIVEDPFRDVAPKIDATDKRAFIQLNEKFANRFPMAKPILAKIHTQLSEGATCEDLLTHGIKETTQSSPEVEQMLYRGLASGMPIVCDGLILDKPEAKRFLFEVLYFPPLHPAHHDEL